MGREGPRSLAVRSWVTTSLPRDQGLRAPPVAAFAASDASRVRAGYFIGDSAHRSTPFNEELANRIRRLVPRATEKRMFGGMGLMERGNMVAGVSHDDLVVRVPPEATERYLREPGAHEMMPGRPMKGWLKVRASALQKDATLRDWVERSRAAMRARPPG